MEGPVIPPLRISQKPRIVRFKRPVALFESACLLQHPGNAPDRAGIQEPIIFLELLMTESRLSTTEQIASIWDLGGLGWRELGQRVLREIRDNDLLNRGYELAYNFLLAV